MSKGGTPLSSFLSMRVLDTFGIPPDSQPSSIPQLAQHRSRTIAAIIIVCLVGVIYMVVTMRFYILRVDHLLAALFSEAFIASPGTSTFLPQPSSYFGGSVPL